MKTVSEWFVVDPAKRKQFLDFLDKKVYYDVLVPPIYGTAFTKTSSKKINMQPQSRGVGFRFVDGTIEKTSTFRKAVDKKYARTRRARMAADRMALKGREKKKKKAEARAKHKKTKPFWESVFVGIQFLDRSLADGRQVFTELRQYKELDADLAVKDQLVVFFEPVRKTRRSDPGGYVLIHDALEALKLEKDPRYASSYKFYRRLNGAADGMDYDALAKLKGSGLQQYVRLKGGAPVRVPITPPSFEPFRTMPIPVIHHEHDDNQHVEHHDNHDDDNRHDNNQHNVVPHERQRGFLQWMNAGSGRRKEDFIMLELRQASTPPAASS